MLLFIDETKSFSFNVKKFISRSITSFLRTQTKQVESNSFNVTRPVLLGQKNRYQHQSYSWEDELQPRGCSSLDWNRMWYWANEAVPGSHPAIRQTPLILWSSWCRAGLLIKDHFHRIILGREIEKVIFLLVQWSHTVAHSSVIHNTTSMLLIQYMHRFIRSISSKILKVIASVFTFSHTECKKIFPVSFVCNYNKVHCLVNEFHLHQILSYSCKNSTWCP